MYGIARIFGHADFRLWLHQDVPKGTDLRPVSASKPTSADPRLTRLSQFECTPQGPGPSEPIDHRKPQGIVIVHGGEHGAGLLEGDPAGHEAARFDAPGGDKLHLEMLDRPL